jgi:hypothetical protein
MSDLANQIGVFIETVQEAEKELQEKCEETLREVFQKFWERNPEVNSVVWVQYAPYFNDGDPCIFRVCDPVFSNAWMAEDIEDITYDYSGMKEEIWVWENYGDLPLDSGENLKKDSGAITNLICSSELANTMESLFGSDSRVVATREGFEAFDYSGQHD